jgi:hypothetical protein
MPTAAENKREVLSIRERLGIVYCRFCEQDTMPLSSGMCAFCSNYIVLQERPAEDGCTGAPELPKDAA